jgi:hypothetical protein
MARMRDQKGRYVRENNDQAVTAIVCVFIVTVVAILLWATLAPLRVPVPEPEPQVIIQPSDPIDWDKVTVHAIPVKEWQDQHDKEMLKRMSKELQRVIDRNEARETPAFSRH